MELWQQLENAGYPYPQRWPKAGPGEEQLDTWEAVLQPLTDADLGRAAAAYLQAETRWWPRPNELIKAAREVMGPALIEQRPSREETGPWSELMRSQHPDLATILFETTEEMDACDHATSCMLCPACEDTLFAKLDARALSILAEA